MITRYERHIPDVGDVVRVEVLTEAEVFELRFADKLDRMVDEAKAEISLMVNNAKRKLGLLPPIEIRDDRADALRYLMAGQQNALAQQAALGDMQRYGLGALQQQHVPYQSLFGGLGNALGGLGAGLFGGQAHGR